MKNNDGNNNPFLKRVSKLFEDLPTKRMEKPPVAPRVTCTRLRRLQEIHCELVEAVESNSSTIGEDEIADMVGQLVKTKNDNFASWALRNKQTSGLSPDVQNKFCGRGYKDGMSVKKQMIEERHSKIFCS